MTVPKQTTWVTVDGPVLNTKKKYVVRLKDDNECKDNWVVIQFTNKQWKTLCNCDDVVPLCYVTHYLELP
jgi:hypothetical protein